MIQEVERSEARKEIIKAGRVCVLTGAGMSAESGVPTFRGGGGAPVWRGMPFDALSSAAMVERDLPLVWEWFDYRRSVLESCKPNRGHQALAQAQLSGRFESFVVVTQNIDNLHTDAGSEGVVELHGNIHESRCLSCRSVHSLSRFEPEARPPGCPSCGGDMRPNVVLFGEMLNQEIIESAQKAAESCDICIVIGTSALVSPANLLPPMAKRSGGTLIEINPESTHLSSTVDISLRGFSAEILDSIFTFDESL